MNYVLENVQIGVIGGYNVYYFLLPRLDLATLLLHTWISLSIGTNTDGMCS